MENQLPAGGPDAQPVVQSVTGATAGPAYRVYYLDGDGRILSAEWFAADSDEQAIAQVSAKASCPPCELWERDRFIERFAARD